MTLWVCGGDGGCGTKYAVGLTRCPRCHNTAFYEDGDPMAKITRLTGASDKTLPVLDTEDAAAAETVPVPEAAADQPEIASPADALLKAGMSVETAAGLVGGLPETAPEGGESSSPGSSSSASTTVQPTTSEPSSKPTRKPARMTGSRSRRDRTESSSASSTGGDRETGTSAADDK